MATRIRRVSARFLRPEDIEAIQRVDQAVQKGAVQVVHDAYAERIRALHKRARAIDTEVVAQSRRVNAAA